MSCAFGATFEIPQPSSLRVSRDVVPATRGLTSNHQLAAQVRGHSLPCLADVLAHGGKCGGELDGLGIFQAQFFFACLFRSKGNNKDT